MRLLGCCISMFVALVVLPIPAQAADQLPPQFTLGRYVPADALLYIHGVDNPERHWIEERWGRVFQSLLDSGVDQDLRNLIFPMIPAEHREAMRDGFDRMVRALKTVRWADLVRHELVFAERLSSSGLAYEYLAMARGDRQSAKHNFQALSAILAEVAKFSGALGVQSREAEGLSVVALGARDAGTETVSRPIFWLLRKDDVIATILSPPIGERDRSITDDVLGMLSGKKVTPSIVDAPRFREALSHVEAPSDMVMFFDVKTLVRDLRGMFKTIGDGIPQEKDNERAGVSAVAKLVGAVDVVDYIITSTSTKGLRSISEEFTRFQPDKKNDALVRMVLDRKPFDRFDRYIPKNATSFSLSAGIDLERLYDFLTGFIRDGLPGGEQAMARLNTTFEQLGFDPKRDLFSWWSGETIDVSMPAAVVTPMSGGSDWAMMIRVKDSEVASCRVNAAIDWANKKLQQRGQMLMISPASCKQGSFRQVTHPMLAMVARPVIGVQDDWLVIAKSPETVNRCLAVSGGEAPSILKNDRFREEGLVPDGPVHSLSYEDLTRRGEEWGGAAAAVGMAGGMAVGMMPPEAPQEFRQLLQGVLGIVAKLAPVLQQINFYSSKSSLCVIEEGSAIRSRTLVTYRRPAPEEGEVRKAAALPNN